MAGRGATVVRRVRSLHVAKALEQKAVMLLQRDCQAWLTVTGRSVMRMVEPPAEGGRRVLLNCALPLRWMVMG